MVEQTVVLRPQRCILCKACEVACARTHGGRARLKVVAQGVRGIPVLCQHCETAPCAEICYRSAIERVRETVVLHQQRCTGCGLCVVACPFGAIMVGEQGELPYKCDGCLSLSHESGNQRPVPVCVATCPSTALLWVSLPQGALLRRRESYHRGIGCALRE